jgi:hypothetical protein
MEIQAQLGNHITILPDEILFNIFSYLPYCDIFNFQQCSKNISGIFKRIKLLKKYAEKGYVGKEYKKLFYYSNLNYHIIHKTLLKEFPHIKAVTPKEVFIQLTEKINNEITTNKNFTLLNKEIEINIEKIFPQSPKFLEGNGKEELKEILLCFLYIRPENNYCQSMNYLVGTLINIFCNEKNLNDSTHKVFCFYTMILMTDECGLNTLFIQNNPDYQMRIFQENLLFEEFFPSLFFHLKRKKINLEVFFSQWILSLFSSYLPLEIIDKIFDCFIIQKWKSFFKFSMVFISFIYDKIGSMDLEAMTKYIKEHKAILVIKYSKISERLNEYKITNKHLQELSDDYLISQVKKKLDVNIKLYI